MRAATVRRDPDGSTHARCPLYATSAVFVDASSAPGAVWARGFPDAQDVERRAAMEFVVTAMRAIAAVAAVPPGRVDVIGDGLLARLIERDMPPKKAAGGPEAVIDATGTQSGIRSALAGVEALGTVVLAAPVAQPTIDVAGYAEIHLRGLTVIGIPWAVAPDRAPTEAVDWALDCLGWASAGGVAPPAPWYRVEA